MNLVRWTEIFLTHQEKKVLDLNQQSILISVAFALFAVREAKLGLWALREKPEQNPRPFLGRRIPVMSFKVFILGVGALGSHLVQFLRSEELTLSVLDFDRTEAKNLLSQFHGLPSKGRLKVEAIKQTMLFLWGGKLAAHPVRLTADNVEILGNANLLVDCFDNGESRRLVAAFAKHKKIPCIHAGLAADGTFARVVWTDDFIVDDEPSTGIPTCEDGAFLPFIALTASYLALAVQAFTRNGQKFAYQISPGGTFRVQSAR